MRVIAGTARGRHLLGPPAGAATRPTSDKVREALFNVLGTAVHDASVLDLFAGTGALGIEALSRGARHATFVDADRTLCAVIRRNLEAIRGLDRATVLCRDVRRAASVLDGTFDLVFVDPPYALRLERESLEMLCRARVLAIGAIVVVEHATRSPVPIPDGCESQLSLEETRTYGDTAVTLFTAIGTGTATDGAVRT